MNIFVSMITWIFFCFWDVKNQSVIVDILNWMEGEKGGYTYRERERKDTERERLHNDCRTMYMLMSTCTIIKMLMRNVDENSLTRMKSSVECLLQ